MLDSILKEDALPPPPFPYLGMIFIYACIVIFILSRAGYAPASGLTHGQASPGEFPWTCLVLNQKNDFIGSCAVIPSDFSNNNAKVQASTYSIDHSEIKMFVLSLYLIRQLLRCSACRTMDVSVFLFLSCSRTQKRCFTGPSVRLFLSCY